MQEEKTQSTTSLTLENLRRVLEASDSSRVTREDFLALAKQIIEFAKRIETENTATIKQIMEAATTRLNGMGENHTMSISEIKAEMQKSVDEVVNKLSFDHESMMAELHAKADSVLDGEDADPEEVAQIVLARIPKAPEFKETLAEELKQKLDEFMDTINKRIDSIPARVGGSIGASVIHKFIDDDSLVGVKNDSNTTFTLSKAPVNGSLKLYRGGARQRPTEDYTLAGKTITFIIPPSANEILCADYRYF